MSKDTPEADLVSADSHIEIPTGIWLERSLAESAHSVIDGSDSGTRCRRSYLGAVAWHPADDYSTSVGEYQGDGHSPQQRLDDMDLDGVRADLLYPPLLFDVIAAIGLPHELSLAVSSSYNDWLSKVFCSYRPSRLWGLATVPSCCVEHGIAEAKRSRDLPGIVGISLQQWPGGQERPSSEDDAFWDFAVQEDVPTTFHVGLGAGLLADREREGVPTAYILAPFGGHTEYVVAQFIASGLFERFPDLRVAAGETGIGWLPFFMEQMDLNYDRYRHSTECGRLRRRPSDYVRDNFLFVIQEDRAGLASCDEQILRNTMWGSDYPHTVTNWPASRELLSSQLAHLPVDVQTAIQSATVSDFYRRETR